MPRRLAAILAADAANFSGLMAANEERTLRALAGHRTIIDGAIAAHGGRIVSTAGDSVLAEFASAVQAVRAAIQIQTTLAASHARAAEGEALRFRIGINVGDIVADGTDILGDGVNIAVRLENVAQPGGILISSSVRDHIAGKIVEPLEDLGSQYLKNIPRPVRTYRVVTGDRAESSLALRARRIAPRALGAAALLTAAVLSIGAWWNAHVQSNATAPAEATNATERAYWESVGHASDPAELEAFLTKYPQGTFSELARARLNGILAGRTRQGEAAELQRRSAEAAHAQAEAARLKNEADTAIARAAAEQATAMRLKAEADLAAARAAAAAKAVTDAQHRLARSPASAPAVEEQIVLVRSAGPYDGRWTADWNCEASSEQPSSSIKLPVLIQYREIRIEAGQAGLPGYVRAYGRIGDDGSFDLKGTSLPRTQRIVGAEQHMTANGRSESDRLEGHGNIGTRRCSVLIARGNAP